MSRHAPWRRPTILLLGTVTLMAALCLAGPRPLPGSAEASTAGLSAAAPEALSSARQPNLVFFLTDDMSSYHLRHMPNTRRLIFREGARFTNHYANVALCCPSRASILSGKYAHNTGVRSNAFPGGFHGFRSGDEGSRTFAVALEAAGYHTSLMGKYLNGYPFMSSGDLPPVASTYVPPGWSDWAVPIRGAFRGRNYELNLNGRIVHQQGPRNYLGDYLVRRTLGKIRRNSEGRGLAVVESFYGPHLPAPASPVERRDRGLRREVSTLQVPRTPDFDERDVSDKPAHIQGLPRLGRWAKGRLDEAFRRQVVSLTSIDRYVEAVVRSLRRTGQLRNTYLVFTSDHGYHMGHHRLPVGKNAPYQSDVAVPLAIRGPDIEPGTVVDEVTVNIDLAPTFAEMAGIRLPYAHDGESLLPLARGEAPESWREFAYLHKGRSSDYATTVDGLTEPATRMERSTEQTIPTWRAAVSSRYTYIQYGTGEEELYDLREDPRQLDNLLARSPGGGSAGDRAIRNRMDAALTRLSDCVGAEECRVR